MVLGRTADGTPDRWLEVWTLYPDLRESQTQTELYSWRLRPVATRWTKPLPENNSIISSLMNPANR